MSTGELILMGAGFVLAAIFGVLWRKEGGRASGLATQLAGANTERSQLTADLTREKQIRKEKTEQLATFRQRADKQSKRKKKKGASELPMGTATRLGDLEDRMAGLTRERDGFRTERDSLADQVVGLEARAAHLQKTLDAAADHKTSGSKPAVAAAAESPPSVSAASGDEGADPLQAELAEAREEAVKLAETLRTAKEAEARMRKRMANQEMLYASVRSELDVKKDRLRTQEEQIQRLQAMKAVLSD